MTFTGLEEKFGHYNFSLAMPVNVSHKNPFTMSYTQTHLTVNINSEVCVYIVT